MTLLWLFWKILILWCEFLMPRPLKWNILGAHTISLSKNIHRVTKTDYEWFKFLWIWRYHRTTICWNDNICLGLLSQARWKRNPSRTKWAISATHCCLLCYSLRGSYIPQWNFLLNCSFIASKTQLDIWQMYLYRYDY